MKLYDISVPIHETAEGLPSIHELIEKLAEMLDRDQINYFIALPNAEDQEKDEKLAYKLYYLSEQNTELTLIVSLFTSLYLKRGKQKILEAIVRSFGNSAE